MGIETAIIAAAILGTGASVYAAGKQGEAVRESAAASTTATQEQIAFQKDELRRTRADLADAVDAGLIDLDTAYAEATGQFEPYTDPFAFNMARQYLESPQDIFQLPGVQFQYEQGQKGLENLLSKTTGGGLSGGAVKEAQRYGQNFAATMLDQSLNRLSPFINIQQQAGANIANLATGLGRAKSGLRMSGATGQAGITGQMTPSISQRIGEMGSIEANRAIGMGGVYGNLATNLAGTGQGALQSLMLQNILNRGAGGGGVPRSTFSAGSTPAIERFGFR